MKKMDSRKRKLTLQLSHDDSWDDCGWWYWSVSQPKHLIENDSVLVCPFFIPRDSIGLTDSEFSTWYDFRSLNLHEALFGEGVSEELANSWLQPENRLAGGRLEEERWTNTQPQTKRASPHLTWIIRFISQSWRGVKTHLPISANSLNLKAGTCEWWRGQDVCLKPAGALETVMNANNWNRGWWEEIWSKGNRRLL